MILLWEVVICRPSVFATKIYAKAITKSATTHPMVPITLKIRNVGSAYTNSLAVDFNN